MASLPGSSSTWPPLESNASGDAAGAVASSSGEKNNALLPWNVESFAQSMNAFDQTAANLQLLAIAALDKERVQIVHPNLAEPNFERPEWMDDEEIPVANPDGGVKGKMPAALLHEVCVKFKITVPIFEVKEIVEDPSSLHVFRIAVYIRDMALQVNGMGHSKMHAKHDAASKAFEVIHGAAERGVPLHLVWHDTLVQMSRMIKGAPLIVPSEEGRASPELVFAPSRLNSWATANNTQVDYDLKEVRGPSHRREFVMVCKVGFVSTEGHGKTKKAAKQMAASQMISELGLNV